MRSRVFTVIIAISILAVVFACAGITAQQAAKENAKPKEPAQVIGKADYMKSAWGDKKTVLMKGNVSFTHEDTVITSSQVDYDGTSKIAVSPGKITINDPECDILGDKGCAYFNKRLGVVEGDVVMNLKPKSTEPGADKESVRTKLNKPTTITCKKLEYQYKNKIASASGSVIFKQTNRTASADTAVYDEKKELLTLSGNVKGIDEYGQTFSAPDNVVISLKKGDEWMEAPHSSATFKIDLDKEEGDKAQ